MSPTAGDGSSKPQTLTVAASSAAFTGPASSGGSSGGGDQPEVLPVEERKAAMSGLDPMEAKWTLAALILATLAGLAIPAYFIAENKVTKAGKNTIAVAPDAKLLGGVILVLCAIGFVALWKRKRTLVAFDLFLVGFAFTLFVGLIGFVFILLGGFLMLRAWRINKYGTTNSKLIAGEAAAAAQGTAAQRGGTGHLQDELDPGRPQAADSQQALHAQGADAEEDPQTHRVQRVSLDPTGYSPRQSAGSISSAERSNARASVRRRTNDLAVGSSPRARSTSTSVTIPITVE